MTSLPIDRRQAALSFGALWTALVIPAGALAQATPALTWTPKALTAIQARTLDAVAELIIPATDTPGAREAGVPAFVDRWVGNWCAAADAKAIRTGLDRIEADAKAAHGAGFASLTVQQQTSILLRHDVPAVAAGVGRGDTETGLTNAAARAAPFFPQLKELVTVGYFTSRAGAMKAVRYDPNPGAYKGCVPLSQIGRAWAL